MKNKVEVLVTVLVMFAVGCLAKEANKITMPKQVCSATWTMVSKVVTNELAEAEYNTRTNGYIKVEEQGRHWANNIIWVGNCQTVSLMSTCTNMAVWASYNQNAVNPPDPFKEKITIKYFTEELEETYTLHVGPLDTDFATVKTVLKRWKTRHVQKISQHESTDTINE